ncbi:22850_t:CDS:2, partial [Gigaspora rosea]
KRDSELNGTWNTGNDQHEVQSPNKETPTEALVAQHENQVQDTNLDDTKTGTIDEVGERSTQKREPEIKLTDTVQSMQVETPEEVTQVTTNSDTTEKHGMILEAPTQQLTNEMQETTTKEQYGTGTPVKSQESKITQLNKKISALREQRAKKGANWQLDTQLEELKVQLGLETASLSEKWWLRSKAKWIEEGEKSTKYFFTREKITASLPQVTETMNNSLIREIIQEEVKTVIQNLPRGKSPGTDGLMYEFYQATEEEVTPVLTMLFNNVLEEGKMPSSWHKSLITLIPKKSEELELINNWRPISLDINNEKDSLQYIRDFYEKLYNPEGIDETALNEITRDLLQLAKTVALLLEAVFNKVLKEGRMPSSWHKNLLILISKKEENLEEIGNWRPIFLVNSNTKIFMKIMTGRLNEETMRSQSPLKSVETYADDLSIGMSSRSDWNRLTELLQIYKAASNRVELKDEEEFDQ